WMLWYIRATMREIGLPAATFDDRYQERMLGATLADEIAGPNGQLAYHAANRESARKIDHVLHRLGIACFVVTSIILLVYLVLFGLDLAFAATPLETVLLAAKPFLTFASAGLPALGAAVAGIRVHGDFEGSMERSARMVGELERLKEDYAKAMAQG